ncbi:hypothetical protein [Pseudomonas sp. R9.37]|uniref:hypothetical protein n=1 Tax=Pseudomonas sp. R9.37 TaxID=1390498 RepID=UPI000D0CE3CC|nr:hypothetical protein [Pseudomonas sp. R9.37]PSL90761.1 hypothetical protein C7U57_28500 [Pseudomonas sp. R9.37]
MSVLQSSVVLILEKPVQARFLAPLVATYWPRQRVLAVYTLYLGLYEFRYPRGLTFSDLPYTGNPAWKERTFNYAHPALVVELSSGEVCKTALEPAQVIASATTIWYGCDPDASGANAYQVLLTQCLGAEAAAVERPAMFLTGLDKTSIQKALDASTTTEDPLFQTWLKKGEAKRFFDFNYNVNALALFGASLRNVGVDTANYGLSKYSLQLLYFLNSCSQHHEWRLFNLMDRWPGTGRYGPSSLGSVASRAFIVEGLISARLVERAEGLVCISNRGREFLGQLHPDCQDQDLPARLAEWQIEWPASRKKIERYLRTFFGKQLRFKSSL